MSERLPKDLSVLDDEWRLSAFESPLLDYTPDPELQALVSAASEASDFPIALVSLVTHRLQFFRAQVGLPPDLCAAMATDRCTSFCQFVVAGEQHLRIEDAAREPGLPEDLIQRYGIRAYVGFPLRVMGRTVGSFCVIDLKPAELEAPALVRLEALARKAEARLEELARQSPPVEGNLEAEGEAHRAWMAVAEARPLLSLSEQFSEGKISLEEFQRGLGALAGLTGSSDGT